MKEIRFSDIIIDNYSEIFCTSVPSLFLKRREDCFIHLHFFEKKWGIYIDDQYKKKFLLPEKPRNKNNSFILNHSVVNGLWAESQKKIFFYHPETLRKKLITSVRGVMD